MSIAERAISGIRWTASAKIVNQLMKVVLGLILARLLSPVEFGLMGMMMIFLGFMTQFAEFGFGDALVQREDITEHHRSSVFWLNCALGVALAAAFAAGAPLLAWFFSQAELIPLARVSSLGFVFGALSIVQRSLYMRRMQFRRLAVVEMGATAVSGCVGVLMAIQGFGVWSLVAQQVGRSGLLTLGFWLGSPWWPSFQFSRQAIWDLWGYSIHLFGFQVFNYWVRNLDNLLVGRFLGTSALGVYTRAYATMMLPLQQVVGGITQVMFPALSRLQGDRARVKRVWLRANRIIAFLTFPMYTGLLVVSEPFVLGVLGSQWLEVVPVLQVLCVAGFFQPVASTAGWLFRGLGATDVQFRWSLGYGLLLFVALGVGVRFGVLGVAIAYTLRNLVILYPSIVIPGRLIDLTFVEWGRACVGPGLLSVVMALVVFAVRMTVVWPHVLVDLAVSVAVGAAVYLLGASLLRLSALKDALAMVRRLLGRSDTATG